MKTPLWSAVVPVVAAEENHSFPSCSGVITIPNDIFYAGIVISLLLVFYDIFRIYRSVEA